MNDTQKEMKQHSDALNIRRASLEKAVSDGESQKRRIDEEAARKKAEIDFRIHAIASGESAAKNA